MTAYRRTEKRKKSALADHLWNLIGGSLVSAMLAGVIYVLVAMIGQYMYGSEKLWDLVYLKWIFGMTLFVYLVMPTMLANVLGTVFGNKSKASGTKRAA